MLDEIDKKIMFELDLNCRVPSIQMAAKLKIPRQTLDYRINKLVSEGVIENFHACVSLTKLGFRLYKIHLKLRDIPSRKKDLKDFFYGLGNVYWTGESSGSWDLLIGLFFKNESELFPVTNAINSRFSDIIVDHSGHSTVEILQFPKMYLIGKPFPHKEYIGTVSEPQTDEIDNKIIAELIQDARMPVSKLAKKLGSTSQIIKRKMNRLEEKGIIFQYRIGLNIEKVQLHFYKIIIKLNQYSDEDHKKFFKYISKVTSLQFILRNYWTVELEIYVDDHKEYVNIISGIRANFPNMIKTVDSLLMKTDEWTSAFTNMLSD